MSTKENCLNAKNILFYWTSCLKSIKLDRPCSNFKGPQFTNSEIHKTQTLSDDHFRKSISPTQKTVKLVYVSFKTLIKMSTIRSTISLKSQALDHMCSLIDIAWNMTMTKVLPKGLQFSKVLSQTYITSTT